MSRCVESSPSIAPAISASRVRLWDGRARLSPEDGRPPASARALDEESGIGRIIGHDGSHTTGNADEGPMSPGRRKKPAGSFFIHGLPVAIKVVLGGDNRGRSPPRRR